MLIGSTAGYITLALDLANGTDDDTDISSVDEDVEEMDIDADEAGFGQDVRDKGPRDAGDVETELLQDAGPVMGPRALASILLASKAGRSFKINPSQLLTNVT